MGVRLEFALIAAAILLPVALRTASTVRFSSSSDRPGLGM
jgi:hypothetical protein